jgi:hypothetical protein
MKKLGAVAGLCAAAITALAGAWTASATTNDSVFLQVLAERGSALALGMQSPYVPNPIGPERCVFVIPIATPGHSMCPEGVNPPEVTP